MALPFSGQLKTNEIFGAIFNMILGQEVWAQNIKGTSSKLVENAKVDAGLYGDTRLYYFTDALKTHAWGPVVGDSAYGGAMGTEASQLLALDRPDSPFCQPIVIDTFRQIRLTVDDYLSKRAWGDEYAFGQFTSVMLGWLSNTRKIYEATLYNTYIGQTVGANDLVIDVPAPDTTNASTLEASNRMFAQYLAEGIADEFIKLTDLNRINELGYLRSWDMEDLVVVWNSAIVNRIKKIDMPTLFHKEGLIDKFEEAVLPERYFAEPVNSTLTVANYISAAYDIFANVEMDVAYGTSGANYRVIHYFPGDLIAKIVNNTNLGGNVATLTIKEYKPDGAALYTTTFAANDYSKFGDDVVVCKIMHKQAVPLLSAFETGTSFFNPRSLTENHYLTFGHSTLQILKGLPFVTVYANEV